MFREVRLKRCFSCVLTRRQPRPGDFELNERGKIKLEHTKAYFKNVDGYHAQNIV